MSANYVATAVLLLLILCGRSFEKIGLRGYLTVAVLAALASCGRMMIQSIPSVQPATFIVMLCGLLLGSSAGFYCGVVVALLSSLLISIGPWTPYQALFWGLSGLCVVLVDSRRRYVVALKNAAAPFFDKINLLIFRQKEKEQSFSAKLAHHGLMVVRFLLQPDKLLLAAYGFTVGFLFGWGMNLWYYADGSAPFTLSAFFMSCVASFSFDLAHALTNAVLLLLFSDSLFSLLKGILDAKTRP